jgi:hypothetical protein
MFGITCTGLSPAKARLSRRFQLSAHEHWPGPRSLVTTNGISVDVFSSGYLDISVPQVRFFTPMYSAEDTFQITGNHASKSRIPVTEGGLPHSEIHGSKFVRNSPRLIAAYHVLHRLLPPRHPLNALKSLDYSHYQCSPSAECASTIEKTRSSEINPTAARFECHRSLTDGQQRWPQANPLFTMCAVQQWTLVQRSKLGSLSFAGCLSCELVEPDGIEPTTSSLQS